MGAGFILYAVVASGGTIRRTGRATGRHLMVYESLAQAKRQCGMGDSVVQQELDLDRQPLYIRGQEVDSGQA